MTNKPKLFIVEEDPREREAIRLAAIKVELDSELFENTHEFFRSSSVDKPGCILMSIMGTGLKTLDAIRWLDAEGVATPVIVAVDKTQTEMRNRALAVGAVSILEKPIKPVSLVQVVQEAMQVDRIRRRNLPATAALLIARLAENEKQVFNMMCQGWSDEAIAVKLDCKEQTVDDYRKRIMEKLDADSLNELFQLKLALSLMNPKQTRRTDQTNR